MHWKGYAVAIVTVLMAVALRALDYRFFGSQYHFVPFVPAIIIVALVANARACLLALITCAIAAALFMQPVGTLRIQSRVDIVGLAVFMLIGTLVVLLAHRLHRAEVQGTARALGLRETLDSISDGLVSFDAQGQCTYFNAEANRILVDPAIGKPIDKVFTCMSPVGLDKLASVIQRRAPAEFEEVYTANTESPGRWYWYKVQPLRDGGMSIVFRDTTAQKQWAETLRASEERLRLVTDALPALIAYLDRDRRYLFMSRTYETWLARPRESMIGMTQSELTANRELYSMLATHSDRALAGEHVTFQANVSYPDGKTRDVDVTYAPYVNKDGVVEGFVNLVLDVTGRRDAERALRASEARLRVALEAGRMGTWEWTLATGKVEWSPGLEIIHGRTPHSFGGTFEDVLTDIIPEDREGLVTAVQQALDNRSAYHHEYRIHTVDGQLRWLEARGKVIVDPDNKPERMAGVCVDITARKQVEAALIDAKREAEAANSAKDQFLAVLSHELRTPLTPALTAAQSFEVDASLSGDQRETAHMIRRNIELEARLIDDLLDLTRIRRGKLQVNLENVNAHNKLEDVVRMCNADITSKGLNLHLKLGAHRPYVRADAARLQQVFWNLLKNAIKFTPVRGHITLSTQELDGECRVSFKDTGIGIRSDIMPRLFDAFEQGGEAVTRHFGGLGLGLAITKALVDAQGARLVAYSEGPGKGAEFILSLPLAAGTASEVQDLDGEALKATGQCRILLVEDHRDTSRAMARVLNSYGYAVRTADSVSAALRTTEAEPFDLLISDIGLPDGSGLDLMRQITVRYGIKGIALSGFGMEEDVRRSKEAGFAEHLTKPVNVKRLAETISRLVSETPSLK